MLLSVAMADNPAKTSTEFVVSTAVDIYSSDVVPCQSGSYLSYDKLQMPTPDYVSVVTMTVSSGGRVACDHARCNVCHTYSSFDIGLDETSSYTECDDYMTDDSGEASSGEITFGAEPVPNYGYWLESDENSRSGHLWYALTPPLWLSVGVRLS